MDEFLSRYAARVIGVLSGFDRLVFRGTLLELMRDGGMYTLLCRSGVRLLDFKKYVQQTSDSIKAAAVTEAKQLDRPQVYLSSSTVSKEDLARDLLAKHPIDQGLVCLLSSVEPCTSFEYHLSQNKNERGLKPRLRKCLHLYKYFIHPRFGFMNARIQTWFPFNIQICMNGREWLAQRLTQHGCDVKRADNCFTWLGDTKLAQRLMDKQLDTDWPRALNAIARSLNPLHAKIFRSWPMDYYWSAYQTEWATDLMFANPRALAEVYPALVKHAMQHFQSPDVMRFLGRKAHGNFTGDLVTSFKDRPEGVRVKHWVGGNSVKMYDKAGSVLRVETTIAKTTDFKSFRPPHNDPKGKPSWKPMRKGVADLHRRAEVSQMSNDRYLEALASVENPTPCAKIFDAVSGRVTDGKRTIRALRIGDPDDVALLRAVARGEFATAGFRNRDLRQELHPKPQATLEESRRLAARISRKIRILRAHGLIRKVQKSHRYVLTPRGQTLAAALFATREAPLKKLLAA